MKHLKTLETINDGPKIGDYIIVKSNSPIVKINNFIENNIGQIINISHFENPNRYNVSIKYNNVPSNLLHFFNDTTFKNKNCFFRNFFSSDIVEYAKTLNLLKIKMDANKYNI